jgi:hypothetical protein
MAGNRAVTAALSRPAGSSGPVTVQRNIGFEVEVVRGTRERGVALAELPGSQWGKRDVVYVGGTWDLTLDNTPGPEPVTAEDKPWRADSDEMGYRKFNLEFVLHGGEATHRTGFLDDDIVGLTQAIEGIEAFCSHREPIFLGQEARTKAEKGPLLVWLPPSPPEDANIQLTAGASLAGLNKLLKGNKDDGGSLASPIHGLVTSDRRKALVNSYIPPEAVAQALSTLKDVRVDERATAAVSTMFSLIDTFLANRFDHEYYNVKEATPILWKTPMNQFFESRDLGHVKDVLVPVWPDLVRAVFKDRKGAHGMIYLDPAGQFKVDVWEWLTQLPKVDLLMEADQKYDKSFGGIGVLEGGATTYADAQKDSGSRGHPIFEFRAQPAQLSVIKHRLGEISKKLAEVNK